jgi:16S rRNA (adenine1518-N6/adenine1519-N6)-dimethyltransferase
MGKQERAVIAKKRFGQNFLKDSHILHRIIESMPNDNQRVVEIGPGLGDLTKYLVENKDVTAYEVDTDLCEHLRHRFADALEKGRLQLKCGDVLNRWERSLCDKPYHLVANLPYYIATAIVLKALKDPLCSTILVMVQKEVAEKFSAQPGEKAFSALSVLAQSAGEAERLFDVPPESFDPAPKVVSSILKIEKRQSLDDERFEAFLKAAFSQPRKKLAKNLASKYGKERVASAFSQAGLPSSLRPHEADTSLYHRLYKILEKGEIDGREKTAKKPSG